MKLLRSICVRHDLPLAHIWHLTQNLGRVSLIASIIAMSLFATQACDQKKAPIVTDNNEVGIEQAKSAAPTLKNSMEIARVLGETSTKALDANLEAAKQLQTKILGLLNEPSPSSLRAAQAAWLEGILSYRSAAFQKHIGLVDPKNFARINRLDYQIASFPIQPGFIDAFGPYKYSGLIHDIGFPISRESLENQHGLTDLSDVILGYYAIEFLLFSTDNNRDLGDFVAITELNEELKNRGFEKREEIPNNRRRLLLKQQAEILVSNTKELIQQWQGDDGALGAIKRLPQSELETLIHKAVSSAITQTLIEIGGITKQQEVSEASGDNTEATDTTNNQENNPSDEKLLVSKQISGRDFSTQKLFIHNNLKSVAHVSAMFASNSDAHFDIEALNKAVEKTANNSEQNDDEKAYWADVFSLLKQASDSLPL